MGYIKKVVFRGLRATGYAYTAIGGIRFYDRNDQMYDLGNVVSQSGANGWLERAYCSCSNYYNYNYHPTDAFNTKISQTQGYPNGYWMSSNDNQWVSVEFTGIDVNNIKKISFVPHPDAVYGSNRAVDQPFWIDVYDYLDRLIITYMITPISAVATVQTLNTPELDVLTYNLIYDEGDGLLKYWNNGVDSWNSVPYTLDQMTEALFAQYGMWDRDFNAIPEHAFTKLIGPGFNIYAMSLIDSVPVFNHEVIPLSQIILSNRDIDISNVKDFNGMTVSYTQSGNAVIKMVISFDGGVTWRAWNPATTSWTTVDHTKASSIGALGMDLAIVNSLTPEQWKLGIGASTKFRVGFFFDYSEITDVGKIDLITINVNMRGSWKKAVHGTDYDYEYPNNTTLTVKLFTNGDFKINY